MVDSQSLGYVEALYESFLREPASVPEDWRRFFEALPPDGAPAARPTFRPASIFSPAGCDGRHAADCGRVTDAAVRQERLDLLVRAYRVRGHLAARIDPLGRPRPVPPELDPAFYGLTEADMERRF